MIILDISPAKRNTLAIFNIAKLSTPDCKNYCNKKEKSCELSSSIGS